MANGSSGHRGSRFSRGSTGAGELVENARSNNGRSIDRSIDRRASRPVSSRILLFCSRKGREPIRGDIVSAIDEGEKRRSVYARARAPETPRIRIDEDRCNVSNHSSRQGQEEEPRILARGTP